MTLKRIPFALTPVPAAPLTVPEIERRLSTFLEDLRARAAADAPPEDMAAVETEWDDETHDEPSGPELLDYFKPSFLLQADKDRIARRAKALVARAKERRAGFEAIPTQLARIEGLRTLPLAPAPTADQADEIAAALHAEMPWMGRATEHLWQMLRRTASRGEPGLYLPPMLLLGPAGIGKSTWCRLLATHLRTPFLQSDATGEGAPWALIGHQRGWASAEPGRLLSLILAERVANPLVFVDEVEKAGVVRASTGSTFSLTAGLLPLLERSTASRWTCPFYRVPFDMSHVSWILAANGLHGLSGPFLSRLTPIFMDGPSPHDLVTFARREGLRRGLSEEAIDAAVVAIRALSRHQRLNLRDAQRRLDLAEALEARPRLQ